MKTRCIVLAIVLGGTGTAAVASTSPLREIGHTAITDDICANVVVHANSAIAATLHGDERLTRAMARLRGNDFDDGNPGKRTTMIELARLAADVYDAAGRGGGEVKRLLALAGTASREHAADLHIFATTLGVALERQATMSLALANFVGALDVRDLRPAHGGSAASGFEPPGGAYRPSGRTISAPPSPPSFTGRPATSFALARSVASDFETSLEANVRDETRAAERAESAVTGC